VKGFKSQGDKTNLWSRNEATGLKPGSSALSLWNLCLAFPGNPCEDGTCPSSSLPFSEGESNCRARFCNPFTGASSFLKSRIHFI
jgi:hypothetical protein